MDAAAADGAAAGTGAGADAAKADVAAAGVGAGAGKEEEESTGALAGMGSEVEGAGEAREVTKLPMAGRFSCMKWGLQ